MSPSAVRAETIEALRRQLVSTQRDQSAQKCIPTGLESLDQLLPGGGLPTSAMVEWISDEVGHSAASIALRCVAPMLTLAGCLAVIDERHEFHANAAQAQGIPLSRLLLVRPQREADSDSNHRTGRSQFVRRTSAAHNETLWALEQAARCPGVRIVLCWLDRSSSAVMRRLQLAVERSGVTVVLIRPATVLQQPSFADLRLHVQTLSQASTANVQSPKPSGQFSVRLLRSRHGLQHEGFAVVQQKPWEEHVCSQQSAGTR